MTEGESLGPTKGVAKLTHTIPAGPVLTNPPPNAVVSTADLVVRWLPVDSTIEGTPAKIIAYQLIIEQGENQTLSSSVFSTGVLQ